MGLDSGEFWSRLNSPPPHLSQKSVIVAVVDSGFDFTHPELQGRVWHNAGEVPANGIDDDCNGYIDDTRMEFPGQCGREGYLQRRR